VVAYGRRPRRNQRESAYVSRQRTWRTPPEPSSTLCKRYFNVMEAAVLEELLNFIGSSCLRGISLEFILPRDFAHLDIGMYPSDSIGIAKRA
jgi:hypothetical protein